MKIKARHFTFLIIIFCWFYINQVQPQAIPVPPPPTPLPNLENKQVEIFETVDYVFILQLDINSNVTLSVQDTEKSDNIGNISNTNALTEFFSVLKNTNSKNSKRTKINSSIIVKADPNLNFGSIVDFLKKIRNLSDNNIKLEISRSLSEPYILIPKEPKGNSNSIIKPNPLTLLAQITSDKKITLNNENAGILYDLSELKKLLTKIFQLREENLVFREGTNEVEKTVFFKADQSLHFSEVIQLIIAIKEAGTSPIMLALDGEGKSILKIDEKNILNPK